VTDGSQGGDKAVREKETRKVAQKLGIKKVIFLRQTDRYITINDTTIKNITQIIDTSNGEEKILSSHLWVYWMSHMVLSLFLKSI
jgi:LmbE family N-acetylglucosaminyl deacetylase